MFTLCTYKSASSDEQNGMALVSISFLQSYVQHYVLSDLLKNIHFKSERDKFLKWMSFNKCDKLLINYI
jgi:hypothetical protein